MPLDLLTFEKANSSEEKLTRLSNEALENDSLKLLYLFKALGEKCKSLKRK